MGCGASAGDKTVLPTVPLAKQDTLAQDGPTAVKKQTQNAPLTITKIDDKKPNPQQEKDKTNLKTTLNKEQAKSKADSKNNLQNSTTDIRTSSNQKRNDSLSKTEVKGKTNDLRTSSLSKSQSSSKIYNEGSPSKKNGNPQDLQRLKLAESVIEQEQLKVTQTQTKEKTVKKIKSVKNNKELTDLIKIYGL